MQLAKKALQFLERFREILPREIDEKQLTRMSGKSLEWVCFVERSNFICFENKAEVSGAFVVSIASMPRQLCA